MNLETVLSGIVCVEVESPVPPEFAISNRLEADLLLHVHDLLNTFIFTRREFLSR